MNRIVNSPSARDIAYHFHPVTNARRHEKVGPIIIERGQGIYVYDDQGKEYIEGLAGLWSVAVGFGEKRLAEAGYRQLQQLPYYHSFSHKTHPHAIDLSERLVRMAPGKMSKVFYTNSGSEANDTVVKLVWYYNNARGRPQKKKIISRIKAYHGINVASGSLTGLPGNHRDFDLPIANIIHTGCPHHYRFAKPGESEEAFATRLAEELEALIQKEGPDTVAAFIGEPVMAAGGVMVPPRTYWEKIQKVCRKHDMLIIADEVITGFGRTGKPFGCNTYGIEPDMVVVSKQITSSYQPLAAVLFTEEIYNVVADNTAKIGTFGHGYTASAHPVALAVAMENLDIIEERNLMGRAAELSPTLQTGLRRLADHPLVGEVRGVGLIGAVELVADKATKAPFDASRGVGMYLFDRAHVHGLVIRAIGDTIAFCPPLIIEKAQIEEMLNRFGKALEDTHAWLKGTAAAAAQ
jgi:4-aminobutyrate--pyruvate transaminase